MAGGQGLHSSGELSGWQGWKTRFYTAVLGWPPCVDSVSSSNSTGSQSRHGAEPFAWIYFSNSHSASLEKGGLDSVHRRNRLEEGRAIIAERGKLALEATD